jgi:AcrR family transcriptional regulator
MTPNKEKALAALLTSKTKDAAAKAAGIAPRTLRTYFDDPEFVRAYKKAFASLVEDATRQAQQTIGPALDTLREIIENPDENTTARVSASRSAIEFALRLTEANDIIAELRELSGGDL